MEVQLTQNLIPTTKCVQYTWSVVNAVNVGDKPGLKLDSQPELLSQANPVYDISKCSATFLAFAFFS